MDGKHERCDACKCTKFIYSTKLEGDKWVWKKICENCGKVVETRVLKK